MPVGHLYIFFGEMSVQSLDHFFFHFWFIEIPYIWKKKNTLFLLAYQFN